MSSSTNYLMITTQCVLTHITNKKVVVDMLKLSFKQWDNVIVKIKRIIKKFNDKNVFNDPTSFYATMNGLMTLSLLFIRDYVVWIFHLWLPCIFYFQNHVKISKHKTLNVSWRHKNIINIIYVRQQTSTKHSQ